MNANGATTFPEIARARYGWPCHALFVLFFVVCNLVVTGSLVLGASATISTLTGANIYACNFLIPLGIAVYVVAGGLRATFIIGTSSSSFLSRCPEPFRFTPSPNSPY